MLKTQMPRLKSDRIILRPIQVEDAKDMFKYASNPEVLKYLWWEPHTSVEQSQQSIRDNFLTRLDKGIPEAYAIVFKENQQMIGTIDVHTVHFGDVGVIGYVLHQDYWGKGIVSEALQMLVSVCFNYCGFYRLEINHCADNVGSAKVIEKAGFKTEGRFRQRKIERDGHRADYLYYGLLVSDEIVKNFYTKEQYEKYLRSKV